MAGRRQVLDKILANRVLKMLVIARTTYSTIHFALLRRTIITAILMDSRWLFYNSKIVVF